MPPCPSAHWAAPHSDFSFVNYPPPSSKSTLIPSSNVPLCQDFHHWSACNSLQACSQHGKRPIMWGVDPVRNILTFKTVGKSFTTKEFSVLVESLELVCGWVDNCAGALLLPSPPSVFLGTLVSVASQEQRENPTMSICPAAHSRPSTLQRAGARLGKADRPGG